MNCIIAQSGGPTSVINASLAGVIEASIENDFDKIYLSLHGIEGIINHEIKLLNKEKFINDNIKEKLIARPSSILGSCRYKLPDDLNDGIYENIFNFLKDKDINVFVYIGGNDSMDTVMKLNQYMKLNNIEGINVVGCPKTIDNDLMGMDHSPGFGSASKFINATLRTIRTDVDIYDLKSVTFVEIMGRHAGWLSASSILSNNNYYKDVVNLIYIPEEDKYFDEIIDEIKDALNHEKNLIVVVAEGFRDIEGKLDEIRFTNTKDGFAHPIVSGVCQRLADFIRDELDIKSRSIELNIIQRTNKLISKTDANEAYELGYRALSLGINNTNLVPVIRREEGPDYKVYYTEVSPHSIANHEMKIPEEWLDNKDIFKEKMTNYALPLIKGEVEQEYVDGIPVFIDLDDLII